jgi:ferredoxin
MDGFDERDTIFSRMELRPGTPRYEAYYRAHPERRVADDAARAASSGFDDFVLERAAVDSTFELLEGMRPLARGEPARARVDLSPERATEQLGRLAGAYGATLFGTARLGDASFYAVRGRGEEWGQAATRPGPYGAVFAVPMDPAQIAYAPDPRASLEVVRGYARVALVGLILANCLRAWGWAASCTMDGRADVVLPVAARYAGLGSIGRSGLLLSTEHGPCLRLGAVVTELPLAPTPRRGAAAAKACESCDRCAAACPAGAIDRGPPSLGRFKPVDDDACFARWRRLGTDCGLCVAACPLSRVPARTSST